MASRASFKYAALASESSDADSHNSASTHSTTAVAGGVHVQSAGGARQPRGHGQGKPLTVVSLVALIFFDVAGTPAGTEAIIRAGGPLWGLLGFVVLPLVWSVQEALICAELSTAFPDDGGFVTWVAEAFGEFWGYQEGFLSWLSGATDNTIYPILLADYFATLTPALEPGGEARLPFVLCLAALLTLMNYYGLRVVGMSSMALLVFCLLPFGVLFCAGLPLVQPHRWLRRKPIADVNWSLYLSSLFWNLNYFDSASTLAGEVQNPSRTFPRALFISVVLIVVMYVAVLGVAVGVSPNEEWTDTELASVAELVGGQWLKGWVAIAIAASAIALFEAEMSTDSFQLLGMAERGMLPAVFAKRSRHGTPTWSILASASLMVMCAFRSFEDTLELLNGLYCLAAVLEYAAFLHLRYHRPGLRRPYRIPLGNWGVTAMLVPTFALTLAVLFTTGWLSLVTIACCGVASTSLTLFLQTAKRKGWVHFMEQQHHADAASAPETQPLVGDHDADPALASPSSQESPA